MTELPDVAVSLAPGIGRAVVDDFVASVQRENLTTGVEEREDGPYACVEWLLPTAVVVWLADKYFGGMLEEAGKQHYEVVRQAWGRLLRRTTGPARDVAVMVAVSRDSPRKVQEREHPVLSVYCLLRSGQRVKFIFEHTLTESSYVAAIDSMHKLMARHYSARDGGDLTAELIIQGVSRDRMVVLRYDAAQRRWSAWNPRSRAPTQ